MFAAAMLYLLPLLGFVALVAVVVVAVVLDFVVRYGFWDLLFGHA